MAKVFILDQYITKQEEFKSQIAENSLPMDSIIIMQEINYRIYVLKTCQAFCKTAPVTLDTNVMGFHYQIVDAFIRFLTDERRFGLKTDETGRKQRETAAQTLKTVIADSVKRFSSFAPQTQEQYKTSLRNMIDTVLPVWLQYRDTYVRVNL